MRFHKKKKKKKTPALVITESTAVIMVNRKGHLYSNNVIVNKQVLIYWENLKFIK